MQDIHVVRLNQTKPFKCMAQARVNVFHYIYIKFSITVPYTEVSEAFSIY